MEKGDALSLRAGPGKLIDESNSSSTTSVEGSLEVVYREADVVDPGSALCDESPDRGIVGLRLQELDERFAGHDAGDSRAISVTERDFRHSEDVAVERQDLVEGAHGDPDMGDARAAARQ
jgi:hypothetical protein